MYRRIHTNPGLLPVTTHRPGFIQVGGYTSVPDISAAPPPLPASWFLGPRAENSDVLADLIGEALRHITEYRRGYQPDDPIAITPEIKQSADYRCSIETIKKNFRLLLEYLGQRETPYFSERYIGHMLCENTLPALVGYFAAMLHDPNNVTIQASTSTTLLEMQVMHDLCQMVGWKPDSPVPAWAHITADGSVANAEGLWATRETKFLPFAIVTALRERPDLVKAQAITVSRVDGQMIRLITSDNWSLFNIRRDDILALPGRLAAMTDLQEHEVWEILVSYDVNAIGISGVVGAWERLGGPPVLLTPSTRHYSWPKAAALTGLGTEADKTIAVDREARMSMVALREQLTHCLNNRIPVLMVISVNGSTEESAIDPLTEILALRDDFRKQGLEFDTHVDAAWGGYITSVLRKDFALTGSPDSDVPFSEETSRVPLSDYAIDQFKAIGNADSITIDPHKMGYIQYPAGSLLHRNMKVINLLTFTGAYIGADTDPTVGMFGIEGSKPGAAAAAVFFSHQCIRPSINGYGRIMSYSLANARQFYIRLLFMTKHGDNFRCVPLALLPAERDNGDVEVQIEFVRARLHGRTTQQIEADPEAMALFREIGPDQNIVNFGFTALDCDDPASYNALTKRIYDALHVNYYKDGEADNFHKYQTIITMTTFDRYSYGDDFMDTFAKRLGLNGKPNSLNCLRSVIMNPFVSNTEGGSFLDTLITILGDTVRELTAR